MPERPDMYGTGKKQTIDFLTPKANFGLRSRISSPKKFSSPKHRVWTLCAWPRPVFWRCTVGRL